MEGFQLIGTADRRFEDAPDERDRIPADMVFGFGLERYQFLKLQDRGRVTGTTETTVHLRGVLPVAVDVLAREYRIDSLTIAHHSPDQGG